MHTGKQRTSQDNEIQQPKVLVCVLLEEWNVGLKPRIHHYRLSPMRINTRLEIKIDKYTDENDFTVTNTLFFWNYRGIKWSVLVRLSRTAVGAHSCFFGKKSPREYCQSGLLSLPTHPPLPSSTFRYVPRATYLPEIVTTRTICPAYDQNTLTRPALEPWLTEFHRPEHKATSSFTSFGIYPLKQKEFWDWRVLLLFISLTFNFIFMQLFSSQVCS